MKIFLFMITFIGYRNFKIILIPLQQMSFNIVNLEHGPDQCYLRLFLHPGSLYFWKNYQCHVFFSMFIRGLKQETCKQGTGCLNTFFIELHKKRLY